MPGVTQIIRRTCLRKLFRVLYFFIRLNGDGKDKKVNDKRPVNLDLMSLKFPPMAIASILHRLSGLLMFLLLPVMLCFLAKSLAAPESFDTLKMHLASPLVKLIFWAFGSAWIYHVIAGLRHMFMDIGIGESLEAGRRSAIFVIVLAVISTLLLGIWLW
jgi:succinate dehydrogenase / fumarate reductase cytochrome b subunit